ncbi:MAG: LamG domain-containing protein [Caldilineaceae bacterium]
MAQGNRQANQGLHFGFRDTDVFTCAFWNDDLNSANAYTDDAWHHWACTYDATTGRRTLYRDGVQIAQDTAGGDYTGFGPTYIGQIFDNQWRFQGDMDEVAAVWTRASPPPRSLTWWTRSRWRTSRWWRSCRPTAAPR